MNWRTWLRLSLTMIILCMAVGATPAFADRAPSATERTGIARAAGVPARCLVIRVATVKTTTAWAIAKLRRCNLGNGVAVLQRKGHRWVRRYMGPDDPSPYCSDVRPVPSRVAADLGLCYDA